ncbi:bacillithiol system redox-active protein YtxJ [Shouchella patagoniensis]|uniref:bacillithiol system redox-active protein YtxJ n=1 Tax=Shouchella patagoniensis TaxID=228576 RepID=UPI000994F035|nr:bacillithiol system redox-active protein YtxJ [Shouchella patagoniensis]
MGQLKELTTVEEWEQFLIGSNETVSLLFKHSTQCPISAEAYEEFQSFANENEQFQFGVVKVIESRPVSNQIAEKLEVVHKSPQLFVLEDQKVKWTESHWNIKQQSIQDHV